MAKTSKTTDAVKILHKRYIKGNAKRIASLREERENSEIASQIYNLRVQTGLSQKEFAKAVGTTQSVISRLEDADYKGHSLKMLWRIAGAFHQKVQVQFVPDKADRGFG